MQATATGSLKLFGKTGLSKILEPVIVKRCPGSQMMKSIDLCVVSAIAPLRLSAKEQTHQPRSNRRLLTGHPCWCVGGIGGLQCLRDTLWLASVSEG